MTCWTPAAKRFDLLILRRQLAQLQGDAVAAERIRETVQSLAGSRLSKLAMEPSRLFESPFIDHAPVRPSSFFRDAEVDDLVEILDEIRGRAGARDVAIRLARVTGIPADSWHRFETAYRADLARLCE